MMDICLSVNTGFSFVPTKAFADKGCAVAPCCWEDDEAAAVVAETLAGEIAEDLLLDDVDDEEEDGPSMGSGDPGAE